jgi:hypothetical protein
MSEEIEQLLLFPEMDPFKTKIKGIDYIDLSQIETPNQRQSEYSLLPKGRFFLFKSGGTNQYLPKLGNSFPYVQNMETKKVLSMRVTEHIGYPKVSITLNAKDGFNQQKGFYIRMHRVVAEAFIVNDMPSKKIFVDHKNKNILDYRVTNLRWCTPKQNADGTVRARQLNFIEQARMEKYEA